VVLLFSSRPLYLQKSVKKLRDETRLLVFFLQFGEGFLTGLTYYLGVI
jgi:hypothetical protein